MRAAGPRARDAMMATDALGEKPPAVDIGLALTTPPAEAHRQALLFLDGAILRLSRGRSANQSSGVMLRVSEIPNIDRKKTSSAD
jgi:hypothetical protein